MRTHNGGGREKQRATPTQRWMKLAQMLDQLNGAIAQVMRKRVGRKKKQQIPPAQAHGAGSQANREGIDICASAQTASVGAVITHVLPSRRQSQNKEESISRSPWSQMCMETRSLDRGPTPAMGEAPRRHVSAKKPTKTSTEQGANPQGRRAGEAKSNSHTKVEETCTNA